MFVIEVEYLTGRAVATYSSMGGTFEPFFVQEGYRTDGYRDHSAATRDIVNGKLGVTLDDGSRLTLVANSVHLDAQDPLGLTADQYALNPRSASVATQYNTRQMQFPTNLLAGLAKMPVSTELRKELVQLTEEMIWRTS